MLYSCTLYNYVLWMVWELIVSVVNKSLWGMHRRPLNVTGHSTSNKHWHLCRVPISWCSVVNSLISVGSDLRLGLEHTSVLASWSVDCDHCEADHVCQRRKRVAARASVMIGYRYLLLVSDPSSKCFPARPRCPLRRAQQHLASRGAEETDVP